MRLSGIGVLEHVPGDLAGPAAHVEDVRAAAEIELPLPKQPLAQGRVQREHAARGQHGPLRAVVDVADLLPVLLEAHPLDQAVLEDAVEHFLLPPRAAQPP